MGKLAERMKARGFNNPQELQADPSWQKFAEKVDKLKALKQPHAPNKPAAPKGPQTE